MIMMTNVYDIIMALRSNNGRNAKIEILKQNQDNETLKQVCYLALNPLINFYQRKIPAYTPRQPHTADTLSSVLSSLEVLTSRTVTGTAAIEFLSKLLSSLVEDDAKVLELVIKKDLDCGVARGTVNAVWKNLIPEYPVMLCSQFSEKLVDKITFPAVAQLKMDGMRFNAIVKNNTCEFRSRNGKELNLLGNLTQEFVTLANGFDMVFDGELLVSDSDGLLNRQTGNGILNKAVKGTISEEEASKVIATVWDVITLKGFEDGHDDLPYRVRLSYLLHANLPSKIRLVESNEVRSYEEAERLFLTYLESGEEGLILKDMDSVWEAKRSKQHIKFKGELDCDLKIVGVQAGTGKYEGQLGAIICQSEDGVVEVSVGSGFNDEHRKTLINEKLIGRIVAVKYNARIKNNAGKESLFLPVFLELREDKNTADSSEKIK